MIRANNASIISRNITPAPTGRASSSFSNCLAVPELDTMLCQPEMAPQAMVTNIIGHSGPMPMFKLTVSRECEIRAKHQYSDTPEKQPEEYDVCGNIVNGQGKTPDRQHCGKRNRKQKR